jgi:hypothetical protein
MARYGIGAKAGLIAGLIQGIIAGIVAYVLVQEFISSIESIIQQSTAGSTLTSSEVALAASLVGTFALAGAIIGGLIGGIILGLIFAAVQDKYMKKQSLPMRGLVFGIVLFLIDLALSSGSFAYGTTYVAASLGVDLVTALLFGYLLGYFYQRFSPKPQPVMSTMTNSGMGPSSGNQPTSPSSRQPQM